MFADFKSRCMTGGTACARIMVILMEQENPAFHQDNKQILYSTYPFMKIFNSMWNIKSNLNSFFPTQKLFFIIWNMHGQSVQYQRIKKGKNHFIYERGRMDLVSNLVGKLNIEIKLQETNIISTKISLHSSWTSCIGVSLYVEFSRYHNHQMQINNIHILFCYKIDGCFTSFLLLQKET